MQRFSFYLPASADLPTLDELGALLIDLGCRLQGGDGYRPGTWRDRVTGARAIIDLGEAPIEEDVQHPPRAYDGWVPMQLSVQLPLVCPHWLAVEGFQFLERVLAAVPEVRVLDEEDSQETAEAQPGPFAWSRPRALLNWERLHAVQVETRTDLGRMHRGDSLRLWRWRRERQPGWPEATVLIDRATAEAHPVCVWSDPAQPCVLPATGLVLVRLPTPRLIGRNALPAGEALETAGATRVAPGAWPDGLPLERFRAADDEDWID
jgi:hypothetical protein